MKCKLVTLLICLVTAGFALTGCNSEGNNEKVNPNDTNTSENDANKDDDNKVEVGNPAEMIQAAYDKTIKAESYTISFLDASGIEEGVETDYRRFSIGTSSDGKQVVLYQEGETWVPVEGEGGERVDEIQYYIGNESYFISDSFNDGDLNKISVYYIAEDAYAADTIIKEKTGLPFDLNDEALAELLKLNMTVTDGEASSVIISTKYITVDEFFGVFGRLTNNSSKGYRDVLAVGENFAINVTIDKDGFITELECVAENIPTTMNVNDEDRQDYAFTITLEDINRVEIKAPEAVTDFELGTTDVVYTIGDWDMSYRLTEDDSGNYEFYASQDRDNNGEQSVQYKVLTEIAGKKVIGVSGIGLYVGCYGKVELIIPAGMPSDISALRGDASQMTVFFEDNMDTVSQLYAGYRYGTPPDSYYWEGFTPYFAGEWSLVDGVATPN